MKVYYTEGDRPISQIGDALESLGKTLHDRRNAGEESYTYRLIQGNLETLLKKINEEAFETALAAKDFEQSGRDSNEQDHLRYEAADVIYHLLVLMERCDISLDELAAELNMRMGEDELAGRSGIALLNKDQINRGLHIEK